MKHYDDIESEDSYDMACQWLRYKERDKAEDCLLRSIQLNPHFVHAYMDLAGLYAREERFQDAMHLLKEATRQDPAFDRLHYLMARYAYKNEDYGNARKFIQRAIDILPCERYFEMQRAIEEKYRARRR